MRIRDWSSDVCSSDRLTPLGQRLYEAAAAAFDPLRTTWAAMRRQPTSDALVLGCPGSFLGRWMIPRLDRLSRELPHFKLHLAASDAVPDPALSGLDAARSEEHTSELQSLMRISYAVFCLKKKKQNTNKNHQQDTIR